MKNLMKFLTMCVLVGVVVGICGCTSPTTSSNNSVAQSNKAMDYGNAYIKQSKALDTKTSKVTTSKLVANGADAARLTLVMENTTKNKSSIIWANGTTMTLSANIKSFSNKEDATAFYDNQSFGLTPGTASDSANLTLPANNVYKAAFGTTATINNSATKLESFNFVTMSVSIALQQDEIVMWGTVSVTGK